MAMTRDDIVQMAMKAGFIVGNAPPKIDVYWQRLEDFAALIAAAEREECAKRLDAIGCDHCATNIRLRGQ